MFRRDPEPVTDDIVPGNSIVISKPIDVTTRATKEEAGVSGSDRDFKVSVYAK